MDRRQVIRGLFPAHLQENRDFSVFINMTVEELGLVGDYVEMFSFLGSVDKAPNQFVKYLSDIVGFPYSDSRDDDLQREAIKRIFDAYSQRGTEESILKTVDYAKSFDWVAGDIFCKKDNIPKRYATVVYAGKNVFRHCISKFSGKDKFQDSKRWREGVIIINSNEINDNVRQALKQVIPAGVRYYFETNSESGGDGELGVVSYGNWNLLSGGAVDYNIPVKDYYNKAIFSSAVVGPRLRSGKQVIYSDVIIETLP